MQVQYCAFGGSTLFFSQCRKSQASLDKVGLYKHDGTIKQLIKRTLMQHLILQNVATAFFAFSRSEI